MLNFVCLEDYEKYAINNLTPIVRDYYKSGAGEESSLRWNREAFKRYRIKPRFLRDVSKRDISTTILGEKISMPLGVAPSAMQRMAHPDGECANVKAVEAAGTIFILSTISTSSIEEVAKVAPKCIKWFQLYVYIDRNITLNLIRRAEKAGFKALVLTIDAPIFGDRRADLRNKFALPKHLRLANFEEALLNKMTTSKTGSGLNEYVNKMFDQSLSWKDITWLKSITKLPIILKGILTAEDAILSVKYGAAAIIVSNHGARQVDGVPATIEVLPEIVNAVKDKIEIYMDGGIRQGIDVFKALALGANMVFIGRPMLWGLCYAGEKGALNILEMMKKEIDQVFTLTGCTTIKDVTSDMVVHESRYSHL
ncbi:peroxisomal (S)-2-hydroxy-acid oxidase GLO1 [Vespa crabro]|uniref:peroxisomal (S)-2-hydroxy-acid oxidase GLO1 n=1 Tax=Vespa crabro TaxID=7445 RepID=UPI001F02E70D|nr:peroxisomal (S)-2-hydroxy-acid oxidase GLO1 [Vespa crabro]XP_046818747.1 peroxisomal (S)-2-hydroxy-acid oxidase GLO1 [Vespa crabro]XP_046818748.1 peroxisomal (S)-2-hydroxy-acid oxidase GLO1 [Vespa crabro]XP_046818749.1 peroxisomal (S)-2-hydroxy-acid oxidase GLO1 [Vespa crabro]